MDLRPSRSQAYQGLPRPDPKATDRGLGQPVLRGHQLPLGEPAGAEGKTPAPQPCKLGSPSPPALAAPAPATPASKTSSLSELMTPMWRDTLVICLQRHGPWGSCPGLLSPLWQKESPVSNDRFKRTHPAAPPGFYHPPIREPCDPGHMAGP